jgi:hypothetical protein
MLIPHGILLQMNNKGNQCFKSKYSSSLKGQCHEIFDPRFFLPIYYPLAPDVPLNIFAFCFEFADISLVQSYAA